MNTARLPMAGVARLKQHKTTDNKKKYNRKQVKEEAKRESLHDEG